jgi:hypothetical protein
MNLQIDIGDTVTITTEYGFYEGEVLDLTENTLTMDYFNGVKGETRQVEIPLNKIHSIKAGF